MNDEDIPSLEELIEEASEETRFCARMLSTFAGALMGEFDLRTVTEAIELFSHPDAITVMASMIQHSRNTIADAADEVVGAFKRAKQQQEQDG